MQANALGYVLASGASRPEVMAPLCSSLRRRGVAAKVFPLSRFWGVPEDLRAIKFGEWRKSLFRDIRNEYAERRELIFIGHSLGGVTVSQVAEDFAAENRNPISRVFAICPGFGLRHWAVKLHSIAARMGISGLGPVWTSQAMVRLLYPGGRIPVHEWYLNSTPEQEREQAQALLTEHVYPWWPTSAMGVYLHGRSRAFKAAQLLGEKLVVIDANRDVLCSETPEFIRATSGAYHLFEGTHFLPLEEPERLADLILQ